MRKFFLLFALLFSISTFGQTSSPVAVVDFVKIKNNKLPETLFYYENNWKVYRDIALKNNYIISYKLLKTAADSVANFDLILITEYADSSQFKLAEERFQKIIKDTRPNGPKFMNELKANDFRQNVFAKQSETLFSSHK